MTQEQVNNWAYEKLRIDTTQIENFEMFEKQFIYNDIKKEVQKYFKYAKTTRTGFLKKLNFSLKCMTPENNEIKLNGAISPLTLVKDVKKEIAEMSRQTSKMHTQKAE